MNNPLDDINGHFAAGLKHVEAFLKAPDSAAQKIDHYEEAVRVLEPLIGPRHVDPRATFSLGLLSFQMAQLVDRHVANFFDANDYYKKAAHYYRLIAEMPERKSGVVLQAKEVLASLYYEGLVTDTDETRPYESAAHWVRAAADAGSLKGQMLLAVMMGRGEGMPHAPEEGLGRMLKIYPQVDKLSGEDRRLIEQEIPRLRQIVREKSQIALQIDKTLSRPAAYRAPGRNGPLAGPQG